MSINWGERVALVGPNGAGKSTLFRMILDEDSPDEGTIERDEYAITGYLPQEAGEPTDETIIEIAMGITPEMIGILRTMREYEATGDLSHPDFAKAQDQFTAPQRLPARTQGQENPRRPRFQTRTTSTSPPANTPAAG